MGMHSPSLHMHCADAALQRSQDAKCPEMELWDLAVAYTNFLYTACAGELCKAVLQRGLATFTACKA